MVNRANVRVEGAGYSPAEKIRLCLCTWSLSWAAGVVCVEDVVS